MDERGERMRGIDTVVINIELLILIKFNGVTVDLCLDTYLYGLIVERK